MTTAVFGRVTRLFQSTDLAVAVANRFDLAYYEGIGKPDDFKPFGIESLQKVGENMAGLYATDSAANSLAALSTGLDAAGGVTEESYVAALERIRDNDLSDRERYILMQDANVAWRACQPFRDPKDPLCRLKRPVNRQFNEQPAEEQFKDVVQLQAGAKMLLSYIENGSIEI